MKKRFLVPSVIILSIAGLALGIKIGSDYELYSRAQGSFHTFFRLYSDDNSDESSTDEFKIHAWAALESMREAGWISRRAYLRLNPSWYRVDQDTGDFVPDRTKRRIIEEPTTEQLIVLQSIYNHHLSYSTPTIHELRDAVMRNFLSSALRLIDTSKRTEQGTDRKPDHGAR